MNDADVFPCHTLFFASSKGKRHRNENRMRKKNIQLKICNLMSLVDFAARREVVDVVVGFVTF